MKIYHSFPRPFWPFQIRIPIPESILFQIHSNPYMKYHFTSVVDPWHFGTDPDPRIRSPYPWLRLLLIPSVTFKMPTKKVFFLHFLKVHSHHSSKIKSHKRSKNSKKQGFSYWYFCLMMEGSWSVFICTEVQKHTKTSGSTTLPFTIMVGLGSQLREILFVKAFVLT